MLEIGGLIVSGIGLIKDLYTLYGDLDTWDNEDLEVDNEWLQLALQKGILSGVEGDYSWPLLRSVPTLQLKSSHEVVTAHNADKKVLYRIVRGPKTDRVVLMKKTSTG